MAAKIKLIYDAKGWAYWNVCNAIDKYAPSSLKTTLSGRDEYLSETDYNDLYFQMNFSMVEPYRNYLDGLGQTRSKIISTYFSGWLHEDFDAGPKYFHKMYEHSDWIVLMNRSLLGFTGMKPKTSWISPGYDSEIYKITNPIKNRIPKVIWVGSEYHTRSKNDVKGYWSHLVPLSESLESKGIKCEFKRVNSLSHGQPGFYSQEELADWYNTAMIYVVASKSEGSPLPPIDAAACGCVVVSPPIGNMPELIEHGVNGMLVDRTISGLEQGILTAVEHYRDMAQNMTEMMFEWSWVKRVKQYYELFEMLLSGDNA